MKIKKFKAGNFAVALLMARRELGENAVILSSEEKRGPEPFVEVTAAVDYEMEDFSLCGTRERRVPAAHGQCSPADAPPSGPAGGPDERFGRQIAGELKSEIDGLKAAIMEMKFAGREVAGRPGLASRRRKALFCYLRERRIREEFALRLCEKARDEKDLLPLIVSDMKANKAKAASPSGASGQRAFMLIGPTGVGKTTTIAKLAARAVRSGRRAAIINLDTYRIGAGEQVRIYSRIMGIPLATATCPAEFRRHLSNFARTRDAIFIDTTGRNPSDASHIEYILGMHQAATGLAAPEIHLLMSASSDDEFMARAYSNYRRLPIECISFTKVDEAAGLGMIYNLQMIYGKPVAYVSTGQKVPEDLEFPDEDMLGNLILSKGCPKC